MIYRHCQDWLETAHYRSIDYRWVSREHISPDASLAVIAGEDQNFFQHAGFDLPSIQTAWANYQRGRSLRGASTISQQLAKNLFLNPSKTAIRKISEAWFTVILENVWDKARILETYLNIAEFGDHIFGIEAASQHYFGISAEQLNRNQAALLAATLPNQLMLHADHPSAYLNKRKQWILQQMQNLGDLSKLQRQ